jgi:iron complex outermembrane recepter protein
VKPRYWTSGCKGLFWAALLGLPQGLAVYINSVRVNEVFGDTINWDLLPESMISSINLIGGANPLFGLNTLGGALSVQTKNGFTDPGIHNETYGGSFGRVVTSLEAGANNGTVGMFLNLRYFDEEGWRDASPSDAFNAYGTVGYHTDRSTLDLS